MNALNSNLANAEISRMKSRADRLKNQKKCHHLEALNIVAKNEGYKSWDDVEEHFGRMMQAGDVQCTSAHVSSMALDLSKLSFRKDLVEKAIREDGLVNDSSLKVLGKGHAMRMAIDHIESVNKNNEEKIGSGKVDQVVYSLACSLIKKDIHEMEFFLHVINGLKTEKGRIGLFSGVAAGILVSKTLGNIGI